MLSSDIPLVLIFFKFVITCNIHFVCFLSTLSSIKFINFKMFWAAEHLKSVHIIDSYLF